MLWKKFPLTSLTNDKSVCGTLDKIYRRPYSIWKKLYKKKQPVKKPNEFEVFFPTINPNGIHNKIALVIGGSAGVGLSCVKQLLSNGARAVMIADNNEKVGRKVLQSLSDRYGADKVSFIKTDVNDTVLLRHAYCSTLKHLRDLDIVVNDNRHMNFHNWERQIDYSIKGVVRNTLIAMEYMGTHNGGRGGVVVNIVSKSKKPTMSDCGIPLFIGARHFIMGFDRSVALQYFKVTGVKVLSLCPDDPTTCKDKSKPAKYNLVKLLSKANCGTMWT